MEKQWPREVWLWASEARDPAQSMSTYNLAALGAHFTVCWAPFPPHCREVRMMLPVSALLNVLSFSECMSLPPPHSLSFKPNSLGLDGRCWGADTLGAVEFLMCSAEMPFSLSLFGHAHRVGNSWTRDRTHATAVTMPDPEPPGNSKMLFSLQSVMDAHHLSHGSLCAYKLLIHLQQGVCFEQNRRPAG